MELKFFMVFLRGLTCCRLVVLTLVQLEGGVDGAGVQRRVGKVGAALPPGLGQDSVKEAGGAGRRTCRPPCHCRRPVESQRPPDAVFPQQLRSTATAAGGEERIST